MHSSIRKGVTAVATAALLAGCSNDLTLPSYNSPTVVDVASNSAGLQLYATGILALERNNWFGYVRDLSVFGREGYYYFPTDARFVSDYLIGAGGKLSPTGFAAGNWFQEYRNQLNAVNLIKAANNASSVVVSDQQKAAARGFANTMRALDLYHVISLRDSIGAPVVIPDNAATDQAPFVNRDSVYKAISAYLETAKTDLTTAGSASFPFELHSGFAGFDTPATFLKFNRALAARIYSMRGSLDCKAACYTLALTAVSQSFATAPGAAASLADLNVGVYNVYSGGAGDVLNSEFAGVDPNYLAHGSIVTDAKKQLDGTLDARVFRKVDSLASPRPAPGTNRGIPAVLGFTLFPAKDSPTGIIRNEELILIRAEANLQLGNTAQATIDINNVRQVSGNLPVLAGVLTVDSLLYERRYSLLSEGFRWIDARRFGKLSTLPLDLTTHFVAKVVPIPKAECDARLASPPNGC